MIGVPASGKSTLALQLVAEGYVQIERDMLRMEMYGRWYGGNINENEVTREQINRARKALLADKDIVISDTNINRETLDRWIKFCSALHADIEVIVVGMGLFHDELVARNANRDIPSKAVPESILNRFYADFREQYPIKAPAFDPSKERVYLYDIDGTVADMEGVRGPFDWKKVGFDKPHSDVIHLLRDLGEKYKLIAMSGRDEVCRDETAEWLDNNGVTFDALFMRPQGSQLRDSAVKHDLYHKFVAPYYNVMGVFDDRDQVVRMWRSIGLRCYQVAPGNF